MNAAQKLNDIGQSLWLDNITRNLLGSGTLGKYINEWAVTGLTSNPSIFNLAIGKSADYDDDIRAALKQGKSSEDLFFDLAQSDLAQAAELFQPVYDRTDGVDGWVSLEVSPLLAYNTKGTIEAAKKLHAAANRHNLFIKIPGTAEGIPAIEEAIFAGIPVNVTLLFSREHYLAAAEAYLRGIERRIEAGLNPNVGSVASLFISRWDAAIADKVPADLKNKLGIAVGQDCYKAYCDFLTSPRFLRAHNNGARAQRLLWASTGTKDPARSRHDVHRSVRCAFHRQHDPRADLEGVRRPRKRRRRPQSQWRRQPGHLEQVRRGGASTSKLLPPSFRKKGRSRSSKPGPN